MIESRAGRGDGGGRRDRALWTAVGIGLAAGVLQLMVLFELRSHPLWSNPVFTAEGYDAWARQWIVGQGLNPDIFRYSFLYHVFVSILYFISDSSVWLVYAAQAIVASFCCGLLSLWGTRQLGVRGGWMAGALAALCGPLIFFVFQIGTGVWAFCGGVLLLWAFGWVASKNGPREWAGLGAAVGLAGALHPALFAAGVGGLAVALLSMRRSAGPVSARRRGAAALGGLALVAIPLAMTTHTHVGAFTFLPTQDGVALVLGNAGETCDARNPRPGPEWERLTRWARMNDAFSPSEERSFFYRQAGEVFVRAPAVWTRAWARKTAQILSGREPGGDLSPVVAREYSRLQKGLIWTVGRFGFPWGVLWPLALVGFAMGRRRLPGWFWGLLLGYAAAGIVFRVTSDYRMGLLPMVAVGAAAGVEGAIDRFRASRIAAGAGCVLLFVVLGAALSWPGPFCSERIRYDAAWRIAIGQRALARGDIAGGERFFGEALALDAQQPVALNGMAGVSLARGEYDAAADYLRRALDLAPDYALSWFNLALVKETQGDRSGAIEAFRHGLRFQPWRGQAHHDLGRLLALEGRTRAALDRFEVAAELNPEIAANYTAPAEILLLAGRHEAALELLRQARPLAVNDPAIAAFYGHAQLGLGRDNEALGAFMDALESDPDLPLAWLGLARAALAQDDLEKARRAYETCAQKDPNLAERWLTSEEIRRLQGPPINEE